MIEKQELKPCPFCGGEARVTQWRDTLSPNTTWIECINPECQVMTDSFHHKDHNKARELAAQVWNRRVNEDLSHK